MLARETDSLQPHLDACGSPSLYIIPPLLSSSSFALQSLWGLHFLLLFNLFAVFFLFAVFIFAPFCSFTRLVGLPPIILFALFILFASSAPAFQMVTVHRA
ncbi:hypothetical protein BT63DRAFT_458526 [Microthyrium microscopicum]|uniref:Uncharacterized protein n=1 Tax=Microthyrium microscopicum TaxID=703497 RepID=A0A6A6U4F1_9PEZI|nr:hypothetical protein BT63DRAFT_458526 [Microthyrium microscopicum]